MRGDVYALKAPRGTVGHEQRGRRLGVVVQGDRLAHLSTWLVAMTSTRAGDADYRPVIQVHGSPTRVMADQTMAIAPERLGELVGHLTRAEMDHVDFALRVVLGLS